MCCFSQWCTTVQNRQMENPSPLEREINPIHTGKCRGFLSGWICWGYVDGERPQLRLGGPTCSLWFNCNPWGSGETGQGDCRRRNPPFKTQMNTQTALGGNRPVAFSPLLFYTSAYHFAPDLISVLPPVKRQRCLVEEGGTRAKRWPRRQQRNRCWVAGTWRRAHKR